MPGYRVLAITFRDGRVLHVGEGALLPDGLTRDDIVKTDVAAVIGAPESPGGDA
jgi:hypothetical protein